MIIDAHTHIGKFGSIEPRTPEDLLQSMDEAGIDISLLISNRVASEVEGLNVSQVVEIGEKFPRLKAIGNVNYKDLNELQIAQLIDLLDRKEIVGVKLYTGYEKFSPDDEKLHDLYSFCSQEGYPVIFHTGLLLKGSKGFLKNAHPLAIDEVASSFPDLKIVIAHFGNPWIQDCAAVVVKNQNVYADLSGYFSEFVPIADREIEMFKKEVGHMAWLLGGYQKVLFGTDWPIYSQKEYLAAVQSLDMSEEERDFMFWKNAKELFRL